MASVLGIAGLTLAAEWLEPPLVPLRELKLHEAQAIAAEAIVVRSHPAGSGAQVLRLADESGQATAFWGKTDVVEGARVRVEGTVARIQGTWELLVRSLAVRATRDEPLTVPEATRLAPALQGAEVTVTGTIRWDGDGDPSLEEGPAKLILRGATSMLAAHAGHRAVIQGRMAYDTARAAYLIDVFEVEPA